MKILIISQVFYPDSVAVSQHLTDLAFELANANHEVTVFCSCYPYEIKDKRYDSFENINGVQIIRLNQTSFGKKNNLSRIIDFGTFYFFMMCKLFSIKKSGFDLIIGTTVPPLMSLIGIVISKWKRIKFLFWVMDLQPELSISSGLLNNGSYIANLLKICSNYIIRKSDVIVSLDRFMTSYLIKCGADESAIKTIPVWPVLGERYTGGRLNNVFRIDNDFKEKFVIMYSGNHAFVHPLDTLLEAALLLRDCPEFLFVFIGGGVRKVDVTKFRIKHNLDNIRQLPFQPRENIHVSLGSADMQVVILGDGHVGFTHPNKIYGAMYVGMPILYIGPQESHISDILDQVPGNISTRHGEQLLLSNKIKDFFNQPVRNIRSVGSRNMDYCERHFNPLDLKESMINVIID